MFDTELAVVRSQRIYIVRKIIEKYNIQSNPSRRLLLSLSIPMPFAFNVNSNYYRSIVVDKAMAMEVITVIWMKF